MNVQTIKQLWLASMLMLLAACATTGQQEPQVKRISPEELERLMPKPVPNISLEELVQLSKTTPPDELIAKIKASNSQYDLTPSQSVELSKQGVSPKVLDYIYQTREAALREGFADEINKREKAKREEQERLRREYQLRYQPYYDPWWGYSYGPGPYWRRPFYGPSFRYGYGW
ncbi:hypothetical protein [Methylovorus glucosotrophus]|jgi:hypothetical protein|uniref:hypothetical protein n=1 Tax=Methylovorus glucosotrophus TaxID=266009 RepID=UPI001FD58473|nr:hypothetical protein [Methylovorus glucosotrophus]